MLVDWLHWLTAFAITEMQHDNTYIETMEHWTLIEVCTPSISFRVELCFEFILQKKPTQIENRLITNFIRVLVTLVFAILQFKI